MNTVPFPLPNETCTSLEDTALLDQFPRLPVVHRDDAHEYACPRWLGWLLLGAVGEVALGVWWLW